MGNYKFIITKSRETRDFLKEQGFAEVTAPRGTYMFLFDKLLFTFSDKKLNYSLTNNLMFNGSNSNFM